MNDNKISNIPRHQPRDKMQELGLRASAKAIAEAIDVPVKLIIEFIDKPDNVGDVYDSLTQKQIKRLNELCGLFIEGFFERVTPNKWLLSTLEQLTLRNDIPIKALAERSGLKEESISRFLEKDFDVFSDNEKFKLSQVASSFFFVLNRHYYPLPKITIYNSQDN